MRRGLKWQIGPTKFSKTFYCVRHIRQHIAYSTYTYIFWQGYLVPCKRFYDCCLNKSKVEHYRLEAKTDRTAEYSQSCFPNHTPGHPSAFLSPISPP